MDPADLAFYVIGWMVFAPVLAALAVSTYYRTKYADGIRWQQYFERGLQNEINTRQ